MRFEPVLSIDLRSRGGLALYRAAGWGEPERWFRWAVGRESRLRLPHDRSADPLILEIDVTPLLHPPQVTVQRLRARVNGHIVGESVLREKAKLGYLVPGESLAGCDELELSFEHPDARRPIDVGINGDRRALSLAYTVIRLHRIPPLEQIPTAECMPENSFVAGSGASEPYAERMQRLSDYSTRATGLGLRDLMSGFESLGQNCEFGLAQRNAGADQPGLLRFASIHLPRLLEGLAEEFDRIAAESDLEVKLVGTPPGEYMVQQHRYGLLYHTFLHEDQISATDILARQVRHLEYLRKKLLEDLTDAAKIFVVIRRTPLRLEEVLPLFAALGRYGANSLLWVVPHDPPHPPGTVERVAPRLYKGYIDRFAPAENAHDLSFDVWTRVCANARRLHTGESAAVDVKRPSEASLA